MIALFALVSSGSSNTSPPPVVRTTVTIFRPSLPMHSVVRKKGTCWTGSIAVSRPGAWRCMAGNAIYDPCFRVANKNERVVCGANPLKHDEGFVLMLAQPLPKQHATATEAQPWLVELADGSICEAATGTMAIIDDEPVRYPCREPSSEHAQTSVVYCGLLDPLHPAQVWVADKVCFTVVSSKAGPPYKLQKREKIAVRHVWE
jgi:hypothetical protein